MTTKHPTRWRPGQSGNPRGRRPGTGEVAKLRAGIAARVPELLASLLDKALAGDTSAARLLLERVVAPLKAEEVPAPVDLPEDGTLAAKGHAVLAAAAGGQLAPMQAAALLSSLGTLARLIETDELAARVAALEAHHAEAKLDRAN